MDKKRINVTQGINEDLVANTYIKIKDIINSNSRLPFKEVIYKIAGINIGTFYNYIYRGRHKGQISLYTVENLSKYFEIPQSVFECRIELASEYEQKIREKIQRDFGQIKDDDLAADKNQSHGENVFSLLKRLTELLVNENNFENLNKAISQLEFAKDIAQNRKETLIKISKLGD